MCIKNNLTSIKRINNLMRHYRPQPSKERRLSEKLQALSNLIGLNNSLFEVMDRNFQEYMTSKDDDLIYAKQCIHFDLMIIAQLLNDNLEREFDQFSTFLLEQGGNDDH
ncbi:MULTISPECIES: hypothetical protein [unclassified Avibacterium]|uniref:hypothetical protein n=1 Tax=unclassified Avibacterium TaxID=2685287 RepID=UPI0020271B86|nr:MULTISPECIES: hypothetical protein [unclassified Avibacterium]MCW9698773.1 hypothetical protein [Avibacterium sp. 20-129]URL07004.1 hypothetical protein L4F92_02495 [Avibacterium sp. 21-595]